jgi:hypothetical protein
MALDTETGVPIIGRTDVYVTDRRGEEMWLATITSDGGGFYSVRDSHGPSREVEADDDVDVIARVIGEHSCEIAVALVLGVPK